MAGRKPAPPPEPLHEAPDPKAETRPSGALVATARAFKPSRVGAGKTAGAVAVLACTIALAVAFDLGYLPKDGLVFYLYTALVAVAGNVLRHFGSRWQAPK